MSIDWKALAARFKKEHSSTGISAKDWCLLHDLKYATARRYIKTTTYDGLRNAHDKPNAQKAPPQNPKTEQYQAIDDPQIEQEIPEIEMQLPQVQKRNGNFGNQNARTFGHYSEFVTTADDALRYRSSQEADLRDELHLTRMQMSNLMIAIKKIEIDLEDKTASSSSRASFHDSYAKYLAISCQKIARIESIENSLELQATHQANRAKTIELTRKAKLEADKLVRESGNSDTPLDEIYNEIINMGSDGMMNK